MKAAVRSAAFLRFATRVAVGRSERSVYVVIAVLLRLCDGCVDLLGGLLQTRLDVRLLALLDVESEVLQGHQVRAAVHRGRGGGALRVRGDVQEGLEPRVVLQLRRLQRRQ